MELSRIPTTNNLKFVLFVSESEPMSDFYDIWQTGGSHHSQAGQDASLSLEISPVKLVPSNTWVELGDASFHSPNV